MPAMVLLLHELPDGSAHFDWMIERPGLGAPDPDERSLAAWRLDCRLDDPACRSFFALRLPPHRRAYLTFEGPVSGNRGQVTRVATGSIATFQLNDASALVEGRFARDLADRAWFGSKLDDADRWRFVVE